MHLKERILRIREFLRRGRFYLPIYFLALVGLDLVFRRTYIFDRSFDSHEGLLFTLCWAVLLTAVAWLLPGLLKKLWIILTSLIASVLTLTHCGMYSFFGHFFSFSDLKFAGDGADFFQMEYIYIRKIIIASAALCLAAAIVAVLLVPKKERCGGARICLGALLLLASAAGIAAVRSEIVNSEADNVTVIWDAYRHKNIVYDTFSSSQATMELTGLYQYTFRDFNLSFGVYDLLRSDADTLAALDAYYAEKEPDPDNEMTGAFAGKNLILIQLEAVDTWLLNDVCMPNLSAVRAQSIDFVNHYAPAYITGGAFNTENIVNTGLISPFNGGAASIYSKNDYPFSLAHLFRRAGYTANSFHNSEAQTYNRGEIHENWGYAHYYGGTEIGMDSQDWDTQLLRAYDRMTPEAPFFTFIITISGHGPYAGSALSEAYYDRFAALLPADTPEEVIHAYAHVWETDLFIGELMDRLESDGLLENTVLGFYADHYDYYVLNDPLIMEIKDVKNLYMAQHTPFFLYARGEAPRKITKVTSTADILPTLAKLFSLDTDGRYYVWHDAFSDRGGYVIFQNKSWYDGMRNWNIGDPEDSEEVRQRNEEIRRILSMSWDTMNTDYFARRGIGEK